MFQRKNHCCVANRNWAVFLFWTFVNFVSVMPVRVFNVIWWCVKLPVPLCLQNLWSYGIDLLCVVDKLSAVYVLLDTFGGSRTISNTSTSNFTQLTTLDFDHSGQIVSASIQVSSFCNLLSNWKSVWPKILLLSHTAVWLCCLRVFEGSCVWQWYSDVSFKLMKVYLSNSLFWLW